VAEGVISATYVIPDGRQEKCAGSKQYLQIKRKMEMMYGNPSVLETKGTSTKQAKAMMLGFCRIRGGSFPIEIRGES